MHRSKRAPISFKIHKLRNSSLTNAWSSFCGKIASFIKKRDSCILRVYCRPCCPYKWPTMWFNVHDCPSEARGSTSWTNPSTLWIIQLGCQRAVMTWPLLWNKRSRMWSKDWDVWSMGAWDARSSMKEESRYWSWKMRHLHLWEK